MEKSLQIYSWVEDWNKEQLQKKELTVLPTATVPVQAKKEKGGDEVSKREKKRGNNP